MQLMELSRWEAIDAVRTLSTWGNETGIEEGTFEMRSSLLMNADCRVLTLCTRSTQVHMGYDGGQVSTMDSAAVRQTVDVRSLLTCRFDPITL